MELSRERKTVFLPRRTRFVVGVDLGQSTDPTAICVLERLTGVMDAGSDFERHLGMTTSMQTPAEQTNVRHLERLPLGMSYPAVVQHVARLLARPPLCGDERQRPAELVLDQTGVGAPVADVFADAGMKPIRVTITAGDKATWVGLDRWHVAKTILISTLDAKLHIGELRFAAALSGSAAMKDELQDFRRHVGAAGRATYSARQGKHDDLVLAVAIALWWASRPLDQPMSVGRWCTIPDFGTKTFNGATLKG